jgi:hypothetical protein
MPTIYYHTDFHEPSSNCLIIIAIIMKARRNFRLAATTLFYIPQEIIIPLKVFMSEVTVDSRIVDAIAWLGFCDFPEFCAKNTAVTIASLHFIIVILNLNIRITDSIYSDASSAAEQMELKALHIEIRSLTAGIMSKLEKPNLT